jgi:hypothetical protein
MLGFGEIGHNGCDARDFPYNPRAMKKWIAVILLVATTLIATAALAQQTHNQYEPPNAPGDGQKLLAQFVGDWDVVKTFYPQTGDPVATKGQCRQTMIHDGRFLQSEFVFEQRGQKTTGLGLVGFDPQTGRFTTVWTDARSTRMSLRQSQGPFDGKEIVLFGRSVEGDTTATRASRTVTHLENNNNRLVHRQYVAGPNGKERLIMDLIMSRKAKAQESGR